MPNLHANTTKPSIEGSKEDPNTIPNEHQDPNLNEKIKPQEAMNPNHLSKPIEKNLEPKSLISWSLGK